MTAPFKRPVRLSRGPQPQALHSHVTRADFLALLRKELLQRHAWAVDTAKLDRFIDATRDMMASTSRGASVSYDTESFAAAWRSIGGTGKLTLAKLRSIPADDAA